MIEEISQCASIIEFIDRLQLGYSRSEIKRLIKAKAVSFNTGPNVNTVLWIVNLLDTVESVYIAARYGRYLKIGKRFIEKLELITDYR